MPHIALVDTSRLGCMGDGFGRRHDGDRHRPEDQQRRARRKGPTAVREADPTARRSVDPRVRGSPRPLHRHRHERLGRRRHAGGAVRQGPTTAARRRRSSCRRSRRGRATASTSSSAPGRTELVQAVAEAGQDLVGRRAGGEPRAAHRRLAGASRPRVARWCSTTSAEFDLAAAVRTARAVLARNPRGSFLMVECDVHTDRVRQGLERMVAFRPHHPRYRGGRRTQTHWCSSRRTTRSTCACTTAPPAANLLEGLDTVPERCKRRVGGLLAAAEPVDGRHTHRRAGDGRRAGPRRVPRARLPCEHGSVRHNDARLRLAGGATGRRSEVSGMMTGCRLQATGCRQCLAGGHAGPTG